VSQVTLLLHASLVLSVGVLTGIPYWWSIVKGAAPTSVQMWRVSHAFLTAEGVFMFALGLALPTLALEGAARQLLLLALVASGWAFVLAFVLGAVTHHRALTPAPFGLNTLCFAGHAVGVLGSLIALSFTVFGLVRALP
jgi:hypothetical protein